MTKIKEDVLTQDFRLFLQVVWKHLGLPEPTPVQMDIAYFLQHGPDRKGIMAFRGIGKTWITTAYTAWRLYCNPQIQIMIVSAGGGHASNTAIFLRKIIEEMPLLRFLRPQGHQRSSQVEFDVGPAIADQSASVYSVGLLGQMTGKRADVIIADDVETPANSATQMMRDKIAQAVTEFASILKPNGEIIYLGTPQIEDSLYSKLPAKGYEFKIWPARFPSDKLLSRYGQKLSSAIRNFRESNPDIEGQSTEPRRFSDDELAGKELELGRSNFQLQFMLDTSLSDAERFPLKLSDLIFMDTDIDKAPSKTIYASSPDQEINDRPNVGMSGDKLYRRLKMNNEQWLPYTGSLMTIDPSGRGKDETGYAVLKMLHGQLYLLDVGGFTDGYSDDTLVSLAKIAQKYSVNCVQYESNFGGGMFGKVFQPVLQKYHPCMIEEVHSKGSKESRIVDILEPVINQHKLIVDISLLDKDYQSTRNLPEEHRHKYRFFWQLTRMVREKGCVPHDDRVEAVAMAVAYFTDAMARDVDKASDDSRRKLLEEELRSWKASIMGRKGRTHKNWLGKPTDLSSFNKKRRIL